MELLEIAQNIRRLRKERQLTLTQLAERISVTASFLSRLENFRTVPSLPMLSKISQALGVSMEDLVRSNGPSVDYVLVRSGEGQTVEREFPEYGMRYHALARGMPNRSMDPFLIEVPPGCKRPAVTTDGDEFLMLLEGTLHYFLGDEELHIAAGDCLYFRGEIPHYPENRGETTAVLLGVYSLGREDG